jgi:CheY-like chemotaxis protein
MDTTTDDEMTALLRRFPDITTIEPATNDHRPRVLVFEDDANLCDLYGELFAETGYCASMNDRVFESCEPVVALAPALILLDLSFRGEPVGLGFLTRLKTDPRTAAIPVVVVTGSHQTIDEFGPALRQWDCAVLLKPFDLNHFLALLRRLGQRVPARM